ncbi:hypothetical protein [Mucilaginibacter antarcticus]|uniref:Uncharacterized protein n=1 Tax=Mucilaginibacter antarcticus TaxID=1855725 RepID=A0ABW5XL32_9SPHI
MKKYILMSLFAAACVSQVSAQEKLKSVQEGSVLAVANAKIDGNISEWQNDFKAYNKSVKLFYSLSNDDKYLYLVTKSTDLVNNRKIELGGITLNVNTLNKKSDKDAFSVTFPSISRSGRGGGGGGRGRNGGFGNGNRGEVISDSAQKAMTEEAHKNFIASAKEIKVLGFKDITDTLISIYNEYSIKSMVGYDTTGAMVCEMAIPLKALGLSAAAPKEFAYQILLNGLQLPNGGMGGGGRGGRGGGFSEMTAPTDFWGKYALAKK